MSLSWSLAMFFPISSAILFLFFRESRCSDNLFPFINSRFILYSFEEIILGTGIKFIDFSRRDISLLVLCFLILLSISGILYILGILSLIISLLLLEINASAPMICPILLLPMLVECLCQQQGNICSILSAQIVEDTENKLILMNLQLLRC